MKKIVFLIMSVFAFSVFAQDGKLAKPVFALNKPEVTTTVVQKRVGDKIIETTTIVKEFDAETYLKFIQNQIDSDKKNGDERLKKLEELKKKLAKK